MIETLGLVAIGLVGLGLGGDWLVRGAVALAARIGVSDLFIGIVIIGLGTSLPELVTSVQAAFAGSPGIAWGNIAGSNIANTLLILGVSALIAPIAIDRKASLADAAVMLAASLALWAIAALAFDGLWLAALLLLAIAGYIVWRYLGSRTGGTKAEEAAVPEDMAEMKAEAKRSGLARPLGLLIVGLVLLVAGGAALVAGAVDLARLIGLSETAIGVTVVAVGTSLPELTASGIAAWRGRSDLALGNVLGSNIYNILLIGGATMLLAPQPIPRELLAVQLPLVAGTALLMLALIATGRTISRTIGMALLLGFVVNTVLVLSGG